MKRIIFALALFVAAPMPATFAQTEGETPTWTYYNEKGDNQERAELVVEMHKTGDATGPQGQKNTVYKLKTKQGWLYTETANEGAEVLLTDTKDQATEWHLHQHSKGWTFIHTKNGANILSVDGVSPKGGGKPTGKFKLRRANGGGAGMEDQVFELSKAPPGASKLRIDGGDFAFGYSTADDKDPHAFHEFTNEDNPFRTQNSNIKRKNRKNGEWFSFIQNTGTEVAIIQSTSTSKLRYPPISEGAGILHPGNVKGEHAKAQFTAPEDGDWHIEISMKLVHENPTGAGVIVYGPTGKELWNTQIRGYLQPVANELVVPMKKGQHVTISVNQGEDSDYQRDHVLTSVSAWATK